VILTVNGCGIFGVNHGGVWIRFTLFNLSEIRFRSYCMWQINTGYLCKAIKSSLYHG
jgi:hypothetical protein